jgi:hypothetical protein
MSLGVRIATAAAAVAMGGAVLASANLAASPDWRGTATFVASIGLACLVAALVRWPQALTPALVFLAVPFLTTLPGRAGTYTGAVPWAVALLLVGELADWSHDAASQVDVPAAVQGDRAAAVAGTAAGGAVLSALVLVAAGVPPPGGALPELLGLTGAMGVVVLATLARRS